MSSVFQGVPEEDLQSLVPLCREKMAIKDALVLKQGEPARFLYLVDEGRIGVQMALERPDGSSTGPKTVASIGPREAFGWSALVKPYRSTLSATAVELSRLIALQGSTLVFSQSRSVRIEATHPGSGVLGGETPVDGGSSRVALRLIGADVPL